MKRYIPLFMMLSVLMPLQGVVFAQDASVTTSTEVEVTTTDTSTEDDSRDIRREMRAPIDARRDQMKAQLDARRDQLKLNAEASKEDMKQKREAFKSDFKAIREGAQAQLKAAIEARKAQLKAEVQAVKQQAVAARKDFVYGRFVSAVQILKARQERIARLVQKAVEEGKDMTAANVALTKASQALVMAEASLAELKAAKGDSEADAATLRTIAQKIEASLKEARASLVAALDIVAPVSIGVSTSTEVQAQ